MPIYEYACRACGHEFETAGARRGAARLRALHERPAPCGHPGGPGACALN